MAHTDEWMTAVAAAGLATLLSALLGLVLL